jgi:RecJ-like exonuclease
MDFINSLPREQLVYILLFSVLIIVVVLAFVLYGRRLRGSNTVQNYQQKISYRVNDCAWCRGKGRDRVWFWRRCTVCNGQGGVLVAKEPRKCAWCRGKGGKSLLSKCKACGGTGWAISRVNNS